MPKLTLPLGQTHLTITRPIVNAVVMDLAKITGIHNQYKITYPDSIDKSIQSGSTINREDDKIQIGSESRIVVEVDEEQDPDHLLSSAVEYPEHSHLFSDDRIMVYVKPITRMTNITINLKYHASTETEAKRWLSSMGSRATKGGMSMLHQVSYSYELPPELIYILKEIHRLRESNLGYNESFDKYLTDHCTKRKTSVTNLVGEQFSYSVAETNLRVLGYFDLTGIPDKGDRDSDQDGWTINFTYKLRFEKPYEIFFDYPLVIHNQYLTDRFFDSSSVYDPDTHFRRYSASSEAFYGIERNTVLDSESGYRIPLYDEYKPSISAVHVINLYTALTTIDPDRPNYLMTLNIANEIQFHPKVLEFMKKEFSYMNKQYHSIFYAQIFEDRCCWDDSLVSVNANLDVLGLGVINQRRMYRVRFGIIDDISLLTDDARERLRQNGDAFNIIIQILIPGIQPVPLRPDGSVPFKPFDDIVDKSHQTHVGGGNWQKYRFTTVEFLYISAYHKERR